MATTQYVALLRGINVGGNNLIRMGDLKSCLEANGFAAVATYIQSGNVLFEAPEGDPAQLTGRLEALLSQTFNYRSRLVLRTHRQMAETVRKAPKGFGAEPDKYRYDVFFLKEPLTAVEAVTDVPRRDGVDEVHAGADVLYFARLVSRLTQSYVSRIVALPMYQNMTLRNWNTTTKVLALMEGRAK